jgi:uncharacterized protein YaiI (UPF0178 family)
MQQPTLQIWVDADACPNPIKEILFRAAKRVEILTTFVQQFQIQKIMRYFGLENQENHQS